MAAKAAEVSRQERPAIDPESSIRKIVSKVVRKAYGLSVDGAKEVAGAVYDGGASFDGVAKGFSTVGGFAAEMLVGAVLELSKAGCPTWTSCWSTECRKGRFWC